MERHQYRSVPVTVTAVQIPDLIDAFNDRAIEAFGSLDGLQVNTTPVHIGEDSPLRIESVTMTTIQGQLATAKPGEWISQEHDDATRFYPIADDVMRRRYLVPKRPRS